MTDKQKEAVLWTVSRGAIVRSNDATGSFEARITIGGLTEYTTQCSTEIAARVELYKNVKENRRAFLDALLHRIERCAQEIIEDLEGEDELLSLIMEMTNTHLMKELPPENTTIKDPEPMF